MSRIDYALSTAYDNATQGRCGPRIQAMALSADQAAGGIVDIFTEQAVPFPRSDKMMALELRIFELALEESGIDFRNLVFTEDDQ